MGKKSKKKSKKKQAMVTPKPIRLLDPPTQKVETNKASSLAKVSPSTSTVNTKLNKPALIDKDALVILDIDSPKTAFDKHPIENMCRLSLTNSENVPSSYYCLNNPVEKEEKKTMDLPFIAPKSGLQLNSLQSTVSFIESLHGRIYRKAIFEFSE